ALRAEAREHWQEQGTQQLLRRDRWPALLRIEFAKAMAQLLQDLANELAYLAQRMIRRNPLLRPDVRENAALIPEPSAHPHPPAESLRARESPAPSLCPASSANCLIERIGTDLLSRRR